MGNAKSEKPDKIPLPNTLTPLSCQTPDQKEVKLPWGRLYSLIEGFSSVDLTEDSITLGRSEDCTIVVSNDNFPEKLVINISRLHFTIFRDEYTNLIFIKDHSKNGIYVNKMLVGENNRNILKNNDLLSFGFEGCQKLFVIKFLDGDESDNYLPPELRKKYKLSRFLGKGACGEVHLLFEKTTTKAYALKKIRKGVYATESIHHLDHPIKIKNEIQILRSLAHPCVIQMKEIVETPTDVFLILEFMAGGELTKRILSIQPLTEQNTKFIFYQISMAVSYLHKEGITHRDLKPDNILLATEATETLVKITDFGLSKFLTQCSMMDTMCGTLSYTAPEVIDSSYSSYSKQVDVWSLGVILFQMLSKEVPFKSPDRAVLCRKIMKAEYSFESSKWDNISWLAKDLIRRMLVVKPKKRLNMIQVLGHPWLAHDEDMHCRVAQIMNNQNDNSEYFVDDTEYQECEGPPHKKTRLLETTV